MSAGSGSSDSGAPPSLQRRAGILLIAAVAAGVVGLVASELASGDTSDWLVFDRTADHVAGWDRGMIYGSPEQAGSPFWYPPYVAALLVPLALVPQSASYLVMVGVGVAALAVAAAKASTSFAGHDRDRAFLGIALMIASAGTFGTLVTGQLSALYVLAVTGSAVAWQRGQIERAGAWAGLLAIKPNVALIPLLALLRGGGRRALTGMAGVGLVALALGAVLGPSVWTDFVDASREAVTEAANDPESSARGLAKQPSLMAALRQLPGVPEAAAVGVWALYGLLGAVALEAAWRRPNVFHPMRLFGATALFTVVVSPRLVFYDWVLVGPALAAWYVLDDSYAPNRWRWIGWAAAVASVTAFVVSQPFVYGTAAVATAVWCAVELVDTYQRARNRALGSQRPTTPRLP